MLTVKDFKDLGVVFVREDSGDTFYVVDGDEFNKSSAYNNDKVIYFAWRPLSTLPDNPKFKFEYNDGNIRVQWRPLLDQSDKIGEPTNPVFTQAMADSGEFPPVGSLFLYSNLANPKPIDWLKVESKYTDDDCMFFKGENGVKGFASKNDMFGTLFKPIDTSTPEQRSERELFIDLAMGYIRTGGNAQRMFSDMFGDGFKAPNDGD